MNDFPMPAQEIEFQLRDYCASQLYADMGETSLSLKVTWQYRIESLAYMLTAAMRVPVKVLQDEAVIAEYPDGLWQNVRCALGLRYRKVSARLSEHLLFPKVTIPEPFAKHMRVYVCPTTYTIPSTNYTSDRV